ncbi:MAG TPA: DUF4351 domain-containing protein, partial [Blastocatellia bacterium]
LYYSLAGEGLTRKDFLDGVGEYLPRQKERILSTVAEEWKAEFEREWRREGRQEGRQQGQAEVILALLQKRFGKVSAAVQKRS